MTENQERAYAELTKFQSLQSEIRILELKHESALDEAGIGSQWPPAEVVPGIKARRAVKDRYTKELDPNLYAFLERSADTESHERKLLKVIDKRAKIEQEIQELEEEIENLEAKIKRKCDCLEAEVLIRRFRYNQFWTVIAKEMKQTVFYVQKFYDSGLEKFGRN